MAKKEAEVKKKKKRAVVEDAPVKKKKKVKVEEAAPSKKKKKVKEEAPSKKSKSAKAEKPTKGKKAKKEKAPKELPTYSPVKEKFSKTGFIEHIVEETELDKKDVKKVLDVIEQAVLGSLVKKGAGEFQWPGMFKIMTKRIPAKKGGEKKPNPFKPGEMMITKAKPATVRVKIRPLKKTKDAALV